MSLAEPSAAPKIKEICSTRRADPANFMRKFRLPGSVDVDGISAGYEDGVLTITVPRSYRRRGLLIDQSAMPEMLEVTARAA